MAKHRWEDRLADPIEGVVVDDEPSPPAGLSHAAMVASSRILRPTAEAMALGVDYSQVGGVAVGRATVPGQGPVPPSAASQPQ